MAIIYEINVVHSPSFVRTREGMKNEYRAFRLDRSIAVGKPGWREYIGSFDTRRGAIARINAQKSVGEACKIRTRYPKWC